MDSTPVLEKATQTCTRKPELYYLAARLELSKDKAPLAVKWLMMCVKSFYLEQSDEPTSTAQVLTLYRYDQGLF